MVTGFGFDLLCVLLNLSYIWNYPVNDQPFNGGYIDCPVRTVRSDDQVVSENNAISIIQRQLLYKRAPVFLIANHANMLPIKQASVSQADNKIRMSMNGVAMLID